MTMTMTRNAAAVLFVLGCVAGCDVPGTAERLSDSSKQLSQAAERDRAAGTATLRATWQPAAPSLVPISASAGPEAYGAATQATAGFYLERVVIDTIETDWHPEHVVVGDVTGDGLPDVVMSMSATGSSGRVLIRIRAQQPDGSLVVAGEIKVERAVNWLHSLELADLDSDGISEIVIADDTGLTTVSRKGGQFETAWQPSNGRYAALASIDANADGHMDVFAQGVEYGSRLFLNNGQGVIGSVEYVQTGYMGHAWAEASDFTADGLPDLLVSRMAGYYVLIYPFHRGIGLQRQPVEIDVRAFQSAGTYGATVSDIDRDGRPDLVISDQGMTGTSQPRGVRILYRGAGDGFGRSVLLETPGYYSYPSAVRVADLDGNGYPDIVVMYDSNDRIGYFLQGPSGFAPVVTQLTDDNPWTNNHYGENSFAIADVNSDRCADVVLSEASSSLRIFYGRNCQVSVPQMSQPLRPEAL
jgi:hypothetical protein